MMTTTESRADRVRAIVGPDQIRPLLVKSQKGDRHPDRGYCCPFCGSGTGNNGHFTGAVSILPSGKGFCQKCRRTFDVIELYTLALHPYWDGRMASPEYGDGLEAAEKALGLAPPSLGTDTTPPSSPAVGASETAQGPQQPAPVPQPGPAPQKPQKAVQQPQKAQDFSEYLKATAEFLQSSAGAQGVKYLAGRGISLQTAVRMGVGYDSAADPANRPGGEVGNPAGKPHPAERIIIPYSGGYMGRRADGREEFAKVNAAGTAVSVSFLDNLYSGAEAVAVCEGAFDALSFLECGVPAISLNSAGNWGMVRDALEKEPVENTTLILALDADKAGRDAQADLARELDRLSIPHLSFKIPTVLKDVNQWLTADRPAFLQAVERVKHRASTRPDTLYDYLQASFADDIAEFQQQIPTGYPLLDEKLGGGLRAGLYVLAAVSSLGKTSFILQAADQAAAAGSEVLFFSIEMSKAELAAKSIARTYGQMGGRMNVTALSIRRGYLPPEVLNAANQYGESIGRNLSVIQGNFGTNTEEIEEYVKHYIAKNHSRPLIIVDYLQILEPDMGKDGRPLQRREAVDFAVKRMKILSRNYGVPVVLISSVNRSNYLSPIDFESLKESGSIEFSADCVFGLQLQVMNSRLFESNMDVIKKREAVKAAKAENPRKVELVCLKNRYGRTGWSVPFDYYAAQERFVEPEVRQTGRRI